MTALDIRTLVGARVRAQREFHGLTQTEVGAAVCRSAVSIGHIERGEVGLSLTTLIRLCELFGCEPSDLVPVITR